MSGEDIKLNLSPGVKLTTLVVSPEFGRYNELMQRAVVLLLTSVRTELKINGYTLPQAIASSTSAGISELKTYAMHYSSVLKAMLNDDETAVSSVTIDMESLDTAVLVTINIETTTGDEISGEFTI
jgi:hypothetical protein